MNGYCNQPDCRCGGDAPGVIASCPSWREGVRPVLSTDQRANLLVLIAAYVAATSALDRVLTMYSKFNDECKEAQAGRTTAAKNLDNYLDSLTIKD